ncbi:MAG: hypothetical protein C4K58_01555 [Flavobacteriaceae bacterium]|nr:MAG: hypothetical protein C4K58_01555 [Flavobacteriaceae bacterium]
MRRWIVTSDQKWLNKWDEFIFSDKESVFLQSIGRVDSYRKYGMDWELLIYMDDQDEKILMGSANIIVKMAFLKIYVCSYGPSISPEFERFEYKDFNAYIEKFHSRAKELNAFTSQLTISKTFSISENYISGAIFPPVTCAKYHNIISLCPDDSTFDKEKLINTFSSNGRRDSRASYRKGLTSKLAKTEDELKSAYSCIERNAKEKGYQVRSWKEMNDFIIYSTKKENAYLLTAWYEEKLQGAVLLEKSQNTLHYTMGGVLRNKPDLLTGYFLQTESMVLASKLGLQYYDISYGGPEEVQRFKRMFNPTLTEPYITIHFKHSNIRYFLFQNLFPVLKKYLSKIIALKQKFLK